MRYVRFYAEYSDSRKRIPAENVFAAFTGNGIHNNSYEGLGAIFEWPNSPVACTSASREFLRKKCKRISEAEARAIHPLLFSRLDS